MQCCKSVTLRFRDRRNGTQSLFLDYYPGYRDPKTMELKARTGKSKKEIKEYIEQTFGYNLSRTCDDIRPDYHFDVTCQGSVPESIIAFLESTNFENAIRLAVSLGGDADTMGAITGGIAEAYYGGVPEYIRKEVLKRLPNEFIEVMQKFYQKFVEK